MPWLMSMLEPAPVGSGGSHGAPETLMLFSSGRPCLPCQRHWLAPWPRYRPSDSHTSGGAEQTEPAEPGRLRYDIPLLGRTGADWLLEGRMDWLLPRRTEPPLDGRPPAKAEDCSPPGAKNAVGDEADGATRRICTRGFVARFSCLTSTQLLVSVVAMPDGLRVGAGCSPRAGECRAAAVAGCGDEAPPCSTARFGKL